MSRRSTSLLFLLMAAALLSGCWNRKEAEQIDYSLGVGIDMRTKDEVCLTILTPNLEELKPTAGQKKEVQKTLSTRGRTTFQAVRNYIDVSGKKLFWGHTQFYLIGEEAARNGVEHFIDFFTSDAELRGASHMAVVKGNAKEALESKTEFNAISAYNLRDIIRSSAVNGHAPEVLFSEFSRMQAEPIGSEPYLPLIRLMSRTEYDKIKLGLKAGSQSDSNKSPVFVAEGTALFKGTKLVGYLNTMETRGLLWTKNKMKSAIIVVPCEGEGCTVSLELIGGVKSSKKVKIEQGKAKITLNIKAEVNIGDKESQINLVETNEIKELANSFANVVKKEVQAGFDKACRIHKTDVFGFGNTLSDKQPKLWERIKDEWEDDILPKAELEIVVDGQIRRTSRNIYSPWAKDDNE